MIKYQFAEEHVYNDVIKVSGFGKPKELIITGKTFRTEVKFINGIELTINVHPKELEKTLKELLELEL